MDSAIIAVNYSDGDLDTDIQCTSGLVMLTSSLILISKHVELNLSFLTIRRPPRSTPFASLKLFRFSAIIAVNSSDVDLDTDIEGTSGLVGLTNLLGLISKL